MALYSKEHAFGSSSLLRLSYQNMWKGSDSPIPCIVNPRNWQLLYKYMYPYTARASARGAGGRGSIPDRVTPKT